MSAIEEALEREGLACSLRAIDRMYREDPFWNDRFGPRGRTHADADAGRHIEHLIAALRAKSAAVFVAYARWLQSVLTTRGMSSRHIEDNFVLLGEEIAPLPGSVEALAILEAGRAALVRTEGAPGELFAERAAIAKSLSAFAPSVVDHHLIHLADAIANGAPDSYRTYAQLSRTHGVELEALLGALGHAIAHACSPETSARAAEYLAHAGAEGG